MYSIGISVFGYENKEKHSIYISKKCSEEKHVGSLLIGEAEKNTIFLPKISIHLCMIIHDIIEENIFVVIVYVLSLQKKFQSDMLKIALKLMLNKEL